MKTMTLAIAAAALALVASGPGSAQPLLEHAADAPSCPPVTTKQSRGAYAAASRPGRLRSALPRFSRVVVIVMENKECSEIIGSSKAPYLNSLAARYALASRWYAIEHPSLPNYLALIGGSTFGIDTNCSKCHVGAPSLVDQLEAAGISWKAYIESMPGPCFLEKESGDYAKKHNPFVYFDRITGDPSRCGRVIPLTELSADLAAGALPRFVWITPDLCHDMHDCSRRTGDEFLAGLVPRLLRTLGKNGILVVTWDEGKTDTGCCQKAAGGNVATIVAGPRVRHGFVSAVPYDHYSLLRTIEDSWGLPRLGDAACTCTRSLTRFFR